MLPLTFGALTLRSYLCRTGSSACPYMLLTVKMLPSGEKGDSLGSGRHTASRKQSLTSFHVCYRLESVATRIFYRVVIVSLFLTVFYIILVLT